MLAAVGAPDIRPRAVGGWNAGSSPVVNSHGRASSIELMGAPLSFCRREEIYGEGEPAEYLYRVVGGSVRTYKVLDDGRRQIGGFYFPGDMFGLESGKEHSFS